MYRWQFGVGVLLGLGIAVMISIFVDRDDPAMLASGPLLTENEGHLRELVIQYEPSAKEIVLPVYRTFLGWLESDVTVQVVSPSDAAFRELVANVGAVRCKLHPIITGHAMTAWARDQWLALSGTGITTLWSPREEASAALWPERAGDQQIGFDIAASLKPHVRARRSSLYFDGGDFLSDNDTVFVMPRLLQRNIQVTVRDREELQSIFSRELKRHVVILDEAPDHHAGMFMASIGNRTMLVADPSLGRAYFPGSPDLQRSLLPEQPDFSAETQRLYDAVADQSRAAGYRVVRIPTVPSTDGRTFLTYVNSIIDQQGKRRIVYVPSYKGVDALNAAARSVWEEFGYEVRPIDSTSTYRYFGALHCLVNVLVREDTET